MSVTDDHGSASKSDLAVVRVTIERNLYVPHFLNAPYTIDKVEETWPVGQTIFSRIEAVDRDNKGPITYNITGINSQGQVHLRIQHVF